MNRHMFRPWMRKADEGEIVTSYLDLVAVAAHTIPGPHDEVDPETAGMCMNLAVTMIASIARMPPSPETMIGITGSIVQHMMECRVPMEDQMRDDHLLNEILGRHCSCVGGTRNEECAIHGDHPSSPGDGART